MDGQTDGRTGLDRPDGQRDGRARRMDRQTTNRHTDEHNGWTEQSDWSEGPGGLVERTDDGPDLRTDPHSFRIQNFYLSD